MSTNRPYFDQDEVNKEIAAVFKKFKLNNSDQKEYLINSLTYFYQFIRKDTRIKIIRDLYDYLRVLSSKYNFQEERYKVNKDIEPLFIKISNQIYNTSPNKTWIEYMVREYLKIVESDNLELNKIILNEIYTLLFQINKMTQLYYNGDGKGSVVYVHRFK